MGAHHLAPGMVIHPAFRGHTYGSQLLQVNTARGQLVFGSDTYSSWIGIRDWLVANIQQTDTIQQFLAYEKCYVLTSRDRRDLQQLHRRARTRRPIQRGVPDHLELVEYSQRQLLEGGRAGAGATGEATHARQPTPTARRPRISSWPPRAHVIKK